HHRALYPLSLHDALPIYPRRLLQEGAAGVAPVVGGPEAADALPLVGGVRNRSGAPGCRRHRLHPCRRAAAPRGALRLGMERDLEIGRAHVWTPVTDQSRI